MFSCQVNPHTVLKLVEPAHSQPLFQLIDSNRAYLRCWHPWVDGLRTTGDIDRAISAWQQHQVLRRGFYAGIWHHGRLCGLIHHLNVDWVNRWTALSFLLDEAHQGRGIMTDCCRVLIQHAFDEWQLNRVTIECASDNLRSRAIPERLGFQLEGMIRGIEWLEGQFKDHAIYGLLKSEAARMQTGILKNS